MPQGKPVPGPHHTEVIAKETCTGLFLQALDAMRSNTPQGWATAAQKFDESADACRITEKEFLRRRELEERPTRSMEVHVVKLGTFDLNEFIESMFSTQLRRPR